MRPVVLGIDSGTQSTKVVAVDLETGDIVGEARSVHSGADTQDPRDWWVALVAAVRETVTPEMAVRGLAVAGQQHGLVTLDAAGEVVRSAPLWNNVDAAPDAERLNGLADFPDAIGSRLVASFTIAKVAHLARTAPDALAKTGAICLPHDYLNFRLTGELATDRGDASGSGWWSPRESRDRRDLLALATDDGTARRLRLPDVRQAEELAGRLTASAAAELGLGAGLPVGAGTGDNMAAALGLGAQVGEVLISLGTSGTAFAVHPTPTHEPDGEVCGFADATGQFLPLACLINCTRVVDQVAAMLGIGREEALRRAEAVEPGAGGMTMVPYLGGERTPNRPIARGSFTGLTMENMAPDTMLRAALDGVAASLAYCVDALGGLGISAPAVTLTGGGAAHPAWQQAIADATGLPVVVRAGREHAARGAATQIAAVVRGEQVGALSHAWRPAIASEVLPRNGMRERFKMGDRFPGVS